jgi:acyl carrier protein
VTPIEATDPEAATADLRRARVAEVLDKATRVDPATVLLMVCSAAPLWGSLGTANRAMAAGMTAGIAERRLADGLPGALVETMPREDTGELSDRDRTMMTGAGLAPLALAGLRRVTLAEVTPDVFARRSAERLPRAELSLLAGAGGDGGAASASEPALLAELRAALPDDRLDLLIEAVCAATAEALGRAAGDDVDPGQGFFELGMDSVMSLALKTRLENDLGLDLPATLTFECPNSKALARYLLTEELTALLDAEPVAEPSAQPAAARTDDIAAEEAAVDAADLDDDDLLARLDDALSTSSALLADEPEDEEGAA